MKTARRLLPRHRPRGFTLVELSIALVLLALLLAFAVPSFANMARRHRVDALKDSFIGSLQFARMEALRLGQPVVLKRLEPCPAATSTGDWRCGWRIFADTNANQTLDTGETLLADMTVPAQTVLRKASIISPSAIPLNRYGHVQSSLRMEIFPDGNGLGVADGLLVCLPAGSRVRTIRAAAQC